MSKDTPPRTSMAPENGPLKREIPIGNIFFFGDRGPCYFFGCKTPKHPTSISPEVNYHFETDGSFWMMINPYLQNGETRKPTYQKWWFSQTSRVMVTSAWINRNHRRKYTPQTQRFFLENLLPKITQAVFKKTTQDQLHSQQKILAS